MSGNATRPLRCDVTGDYPPVRGRHQSQLAGVPTIAPAMHLSLILDMAADTLGDRRAVTAPDGTITYAELRERADALRRLAGRRAGGAARASTRSPSR